MLPGVKHNSKIFDVLHLACSSLTHINLNTN